MSKKKSGKSRRAISNQASTPDTTSPGGDQFHAFRETVESVVIAFVLAFLFRTFEAEAFVIPTGSMSPSLQGQHKDVECPKCGHRFRASASEEGEPTEKLLADLRNPRLPAGLRHDRRTRIEAYQVIGGMCPMCRYTSAMRPDITLPTGSEKMIDLDDVKATTSYPGDRILVNKYGFSFHEPERWDVVVFKFPGDGNMNYIKRLVGLPNEKIRVYQGDLFIEPSGGEEQIASKPPHKVRAMLQQVHDTDYEPSELYRAGWPLRWAALDEQWNAEIDADDQNVSQRYVVRQSGDDGQSWAWLRYRHLLPGQSVWNQVDAGEGSGAGRVVAEAPEPELITDFNPYNARISRGQLMGDPGRGIIAGGWEVLPHLRGMHWVGDLAVQCDVDVEQAKGQLALDLVEAGCHFRCAIDLKTGQATLQTLQRDAQQPSNLSEPTATPLSGAGSYRLLFANVDDRLMLWVDGDLVEFETSSYDPADLFGSRDQMLPQTGPTDRGDLEPVGVGAKGADLTVTRLTVLRDIYYIAVTQNDAVNQARNAGLQSRGQYHTDYHRLSSTKTLSDGTVLPRIEEPRSLFSNPEYWSRFSTRQSRPFETGDDQFFVLGDNSPESQDCRLWYQRNQETDAKPGGRYVDRRLLIGEAVCVFWPHSWGNWWNLPFLRNLPGFPAFGDMRLVR